jgi:hypothetical protein
VGLLLSGLIDGRSLGDTVVVALPDHVCVGWEGEKAFDGLSEARSARKLPGQRRGVPTLPDLDVSAPVDSRPHT